MRFLGREITFVKGNGAEQKIERTNEDVAKQLQDAAMAEVKAFHRQMQQAAAEQKARLRAESRALAILMGENPDEL